MLDELTGLRAADTGPVRVAMDPEHQAAFGPPLSDQALQFSS